MAAPIIANIEAREILDSRGNPTLEVDCVLSDGTMGRASVPSGASKGEYEALELRDGDPKRYLGKGVLKAVGHVNTVIREKLVGQVATNQYRIDKTLQELDPSRKKERIGANATLGASLACCRASSITAGICIYRFLGGVGTKNLPVPFLNIINGGAHASNNLDVQEYMVVPAGFGTFREALRAATETYQHLRLILEDRSLATTVGDEGGFAPDFADNEAPLKLVLEAIEKAGYKPGEQIFIALDVAASECYDPETKLYELSIPKKRRVPAEELADMYADWCGRYPLVSIEDGLSEGDWDGWAMLTAKLGKKVQLVGDDIFVTQTDRLREGIQRGVANSILIKPNQVGTVSETLDCTKLATDNGYRTLISHRSGDTVDHFIADLAVAVNSGQIKSGAPCRAERVAKYNRLIRIEEDDVLEFSGMSCIKR
jgi:enolase